MIMENSFAKNRFSEENLRSLITGIANNYNSVSYHNFSHGFALMQVFLLLFRWSTNASNSMRPSGKLTLMNSSPTICFQGLPTMWTIPGQTIFIKLNLKLNGLKRLITSLFFKKCTFKLFYKLWGASLNSMSSVKVKMHW